MKASKKTSIASFRKKGNEIYVNIPELRKRVPWIEITDYDIRGNRLYLDVASKALDGNIRLNEWEKVVAYFERLGLTEMVYANTYVYRLEVDFKEGFEVVFG